MAVAGDVRVQRERPGADSSGEWAWRGGGCDVAIRRMEFCYLYLITKCR